MLMLIPALGIFMLIGWILEHIMVRDDEGAPSPEEAAAANAAVPGPSAGAAAPVGGPQLALAGGLGLLVGAAAAGVYLLMNTISPPILDLPLVPAILEQVGFKLSWVLLPPALVGVGLAWAGWKLMTRGGSGGGAGVSRLAGVTLAAAIGAGVLGASAAAQAGVVRALNWTFHKQAVPLHDHLFKLPRDLGNWEMVREDPPLPKEIEDELGTTQYISRWYRDRTMGENEDGSLVRLHIAYYTGTPDAVPHVPERCFTAGGAQHLGRSTDWIAVDAPDYVVETTPGGETRVTAWSRLGEVTIPSKQIEVTTFTYGSGAITGQGTVPPSNVVYFFAANGKFLATPEQIRALAFDPTDQYSYYCKIEMQWLGIEDPQLARQRSEAFLSATLPDVMALLPDWTAVREGRWPVEGQGVYPAGVK
jgi:hypothetical protein